MIEAFRSPAARDGRRGFVIFEPLAARRRQSLHADGKVSRRRRQVRAEARTQALPPR